MIISFNLFSLLFWIFLTSFLPGAILSFAIFKNRKELNFIEKLLIGFGIGFFIPAFFAFLLNMAGVLFNFNTAIISVAIFYLIAIALFVKQKAYENISFTMPTIDSILKNPRELIVPIILIVIIFLAFWVRVQSYSPVFYELDPYFYLYITQQILTFGQNPINDQTAWFPDKIVDHRTTPLPHFMEAIWYSFYTQGTGAYNNYLLADIANIYPPLAAAFLAFFIYLAISSYYKREFGLLSASLIAFMPIFLIKFAAGEMEIQPFAFLSLSIFFAFYALMLKNRSIKYAALACVGYAGLVLGSSSATVAAAVLMIFIPIYSLILFLNEKDNLVFFNFIKLNAIILLFGVLLAHLLSGFYNFSLDILNKNFVILTLVLAFSYLLYYIRPFIKDNETSLYILGAIVVLGLGIFFFTPFGGYIKNSFASQLSLAEFKYSLQRTIAEQGVAGNGFEDQLGVVALVFNAQSSSTDPFYFIYPVLDVIFAPLAFITNNLISGLFLLLNFVFNLDLQFAGKSNSFMTTIFFFFFASLVYTIYKIVKKEEFNPIVILFVALFPATIVGLIKAKFTIYFGFFMVFATAIAFAELEGLINRISKSFILGKPVGTVIMLLIAAIFIINQFAHDGVFPAILSVSFNQRFQDNPVALQPKFQFICDQMKLSGSADPDICGAAADPIKYASQGTNYQYNQKLCYVSLISDINNPSDQQRQGAGFRCQRMPEYWIDSMEWFKTNTPRTSRVISWWDYGHWENFFGQVNAVIRNDHSSTQMIGEVAYNYVAGTTAELRNYMKYTGANYALFDQEIVLGGLTGSKFGALNYLSCSRNNETNVSYQPSTSICEFNHRWEIIYVPKENVQSCVISASTGKQGVTAFKLSYVPESNGMTVKSLSIKPTYCIADTTLATGETMQVTYYLNQTYPNGDLKLNKAFIKGVCNTNDGFNCADSGQYSAAVLFYTKEKKWVENGEVVDGYSDRINSGTYFYDSNIYKGFFLNELEGFDLVYQTKDNAVKIYKLR